jgi:hypothetical protein
MAFEPEEPDGMFGECNLSNKQLLVEINRAIQAICVGGQEYTIGTRRLRRADLEQLRKMRKDLKDELANDPQDNGGGMMGGLFPIYFGRR